MRILESVPSRYDRAIRMLTFGRLDKAYDRLTSHIKWGDRVLDLGCGTGALTLKAAQKQANVRGIDVNAQMLEIARRRANEAGLTRQIELCEMGVAELQSVTSESYDVVMSGLCLSELTEDEFIYTLREVERILKPGGRLLVADQVRPSTVFCRMLHWVIRLPFVIITYLMTQTTTHAVKDLPERIEEAGFLRESVRWSRMGNFIELVGSKPGEEAR